MKYYALILASGTGSRTGLNIPKQFYKINNKTILEYSINAFESHNSINEIIVVSNPDFIDLTKKIISENHYSKVTKIVSGGLTRQESSAIGINEIDEVDSKVLIHDAVRPFVSQEIIDRCINALNNYNAVNVAIESSDTIIEIDTNNIIKKVPERKTLRRCQTPQCFSTELIRKAHKLAENDKNNIATDDCGLILRYNLSDIFVVKGSENNIKITYPSDLKIAENIFNNLKN